MGLSAIISIATATAPVNDTTEASYLTKDHHPFLVRPSMSDDASQVIAAINAVCAERIYLLTECYVPTPQWEEVLHTPLECPDHLLLVPEMDDQVIGWCRVFPNPFGPKVRHTAEVGIGLLQPFREIGIGTALMECAIEWAGAQGLEKLTVSTFSTNQRAINLFKKVGFTATGVRHRQYRVDGDYVDEVLMERFL
jgi:RimJ/RimL family protein N-acetyltransferase